MSQTEDNFSNRLEFSPSNELLLAINQTDFTNLLQILNYLLQFTKYFFFSKIEFSFLQQEEIDVTIYEFLCSSSFPTSLGPVASNQVGILLSLLHKKFLFLPFEQESTKSFYLPIILQFFLNYLKVPEVLLSIGGDDRLTIIPENNRQNKYYSSTIPRKEMIRRGSCTCSTLTEEGYRSAWKYYLQFLQEGIEMILSTEKETDIPLKIAKYYASVNQKIIDRLRNVFDLQTVLPQKSLENNRFIHSPQIVLFPSGSDAEFLPLIVGLIRSFQLSKQLKRSDASTAVAAAAASVSLQEIYSSVKVYNYVIAAGEVGSGTPQAATGQHFSPLSPRGTKQTTGQSLAGIHSEMIELISYKPRNELGQVSFQERDLIDKISQQLSSSPTSVAILHLVCGSKTGLIYPSRESLQYLQQQPHLKDRVIIVVDACQLRNKLTSLTEYLNKNYLILFTGSKFFTGPPFSGGVLLPCLIANEIEQYLYDHLHSEFVPTPTKEESLLPVGLVDYLTQYEVSQEMKYLRQYLEYYNQALAPAINFPFSSSSALSANESSLSSTSVGGWYNYGLSLRWLLSLEVMERYHQLSAVLVKEFTRLWIQTIQSYVTRYSPFLQVLMDTIIGIQQENIGSFNSIISFSLFAKEEVTCTIADGKQYFSLRELTADEYKEFHKLLTQRSKDGDRFGAVGEDVQTMLGQPVKLSDTTGKSVLRIALGADMVVKALEISERRKKEGSNWTETSLVKLLREAFQQISHALLNANPISREDSIDPFDKESEENPFFVSIRQILNEDHQVIQKIYRLIITWKQSPAASLTGTSLASTSTPSKYLAAKAKKLQNLDLQFARFQFPFIDTISPIFDAKILPATLLSLSQQLKSTNDVFKSVIVYDLDAVASSFQSVKRSFDPPNPIIITERETTANKKAKTEFVHCFAIKSCPISYLLHLAVQAGLGLECASLNEVKQALACNAFPERIVYDSPCKTYEELSFALQHHIRINANSWTDLEKIELLLEELRQEGIVSKSLIGIRINPLVGSGSIEALSTAKAGSKFGIPLFTSHFPTIPIAPQPDEVLSLFLKLTELTHTDPVFAKVVNSFLHYRFITGIMCHVGSQGMPIDLMVQGVERLNLVLKFMEWITSSSSSFSPLQVSWLDIGGGLSCNYHSDVITPTFDEYYQALIHRVPDLLHRPAPLMILTEFGKSLIAKTAVMVSKIEDIIEHPSAAVGMAAEGGNNRGNAVSCITHVGADVLLRTAYCPEKFSHHRLQLMDANYHYVVPTPSLGGEGKDGEAIFSSSSEEEGLITVERPVLTNQVSVVGPLCFSGDTIATNISLPKPVVGDSIVIADAGANTISLFSRHCSRSSIAVIGVRRFPFKVNHAKLGIVASSEHHQVPVIVNILRSEESSEQVLRFWD